MKITFIFSCSGMFRDVPGCSGMFRNVPGFIDARIKIEWSTLEFRLLWSDFVLNIELLMCQT